MRTGGVREGIITNTRRARRSRWVGGLAMRRYTVILIRSRYGVREGGSPRCQAKIHVSSKANVLRCPMSDWVWYTSVNYHQRKRNVQVKYSPKIGLARWYPLVDEIRNITTFVPLPPREPRYNKCTYPYTYPIIQQESSYKHLSYISSPMCSLTTASPKPSTSPPDRQTRPPP